MPVRCSTTPQPDPAGARPHLVAGLLAAAQAVEHHEISRCATLITWAGKLGHKDAVKLLQQALQEEKKTDELLARLAEQSLHQQAA